MASPFLESDKVLLYDCRHISCPNELWQLFQKATVEASQISSPAFASFADECLLCAQIVAKEPETLSEAPPNESSPLSTSSPVRSQNAGLIYLHAGPANFSAGEINIGVIMAEEMRHRGYAQAAVQLVLRYAFEELQFHRVQASILDTSFKDRALQLFIGSGFVYEGTKRRALYHREGGGVVGIWKDVTYLAMLDTEWALRSTRKRDHQIVERPVSVWDEMFTRHSKEREALVQWEDIHGRMMTSSTETLMENTGKAVLVQDQFYLSDNASSIGEPSISGSAPPSPPPNLVVTREDDIQIQDADMCATEGSRRWEDIVEMFYEARRNRQGSLLEPSPLNRLLALPSIPSTRMSFEESAQSPLTIPSPSSAGSSPPSSPCPLWPHSAPSSVHSSSYSEDEVNSPYIPSSPPLPPIEFGTYYYDPPLAGPVVLRTGRPQSGSMSSSSSDSWSDAQSDVSWDAGSSTWDLLSNTSDRDHCRGE